MTIFFSSAVQGSFVDLKWQFSILVKSSRKNAGIHKETSHMALAELHNSLLKQ